MSSLDSAVDLLDLLAFMAGFLIGGIVMVYVITSPHQLEPASAPIIEALNAVIVGMVCAANLAALIGRTPLGALVLGVIVGAAALIRTALG